ncbi:hypothetical protein C8A05DRAFT_19600 [Staphylotrichum tortipilum]|uniref:Uncharacterized protein n=1 Tax=Staphylotrichum tortipilum TaxID=2831512 RepID=A0AAN6MBG0_9PEZI|nr:hypothetical protein C8A05DRAFT_19600 [Staphylotrichum longicolle]
MPRAKPIFGLEIEIFVKVKPAIERDVVRYLNHGASLPAHWKAWDFSLTNHQPTSQSQARQRNCVKGALKALIRNALGSKAGWKIISPPMSVSRRWQSEIRAVFDAIGTYFCLWTHPVTSCHVHVSPGPDSKTKYKRRHLTRIAKGAFFWEHALKQVLPPDRRQNDYAKPNPTAFATREYNRVADKGWAPVFDAIDHEMARFGRHWQGQVHCFSIKIAGGRLRHPNHKYRKERYLSTNFLPLTRIGTVELRRQGGVASAETAIHRALLAVTLHLSARRYKFDRAASRRDHPSARELIAELHGCIKKLPPTCHGSLFIRWLNTCVADGAHPLTEAQVNRREQNLHDPSGESVASSVWSSAPVVVPAPPPPRPAAASIPIIVPASYGRPAASSGYTRPPPGPVSYGESNVVRVERRSDGMSWSR